MKLRVSSMLLIGDSTLNGVVQKAMLLRTSYSYTESEVLSVNNDCVRLISLDWQFSWTSQFPLRIQGYAGLIDVVCNSTLGGASTSWTAHTCLLSALDKTRISTAMAWP